MNRGLLQKTLSETWQMSLLIGIALVAVEAVLAFALPTFYEDLTGTFFQAKFIQDMIKALAGTEVVGALGPASFSAIAWVSPVVLALCWAHAIVFCTRLPAGEIDRGTIDVLFGLPVSRWRLYLNETAVWLAYGMVLILACLLGNVAGGTAIDPHLRPPLRRVLAVMVNLYCLYLAVGGLAWLVSASSDRRGRAVATVFGIVLGSFLLNFLAQFWGPAGHVSFLSLLSYYRPVAILQEGSWPVADMAVLAGAGAAFWLVAGLIFARRDICTV